MTNTFLQTAIQRSLNKKGKKNGFTLIELMVVVAIVGVLTAVGLPELTKAQNRAKDSATKATLTNAARECSLALVSGIVEEDFDSTKFTAGDNALGGDCETDTTLTLESPSEVQFEIDFNGDIPGVVAEVV